MYRFAVKSEMAMHDLGARLAAVCVPGLCVFLQGQLGAGKTTFVRGFLSAVGVQERVKSPTYTLVEPYLLGGMSYYHFDLYRLKSPFELEDLGIRDYFNAQSVCLFEWPEKACDCLPKPDVTVNIEILSDHTLEREVILTSTTKAGQFLIDTLKT